MKLPKSQWQRIAFEALAVVITILFALGARYFYSPEDHAFRTPTHPTPESYAHPRP